MCAGLALWGQGRSLQETFERGQLKTEEEEKRLPNGKLMSEEILKAEHASNIKDAARLKELATALDAELKKSEHFVLSVKTLKDLDEMEKLVKRVRGRMRKN